MNNVLCSSSQLYKEIELCCKIRKVIQFDRDESCMIGYGERQKCVMFIRSCLVYIHLFILGTEQRYLEK